MGRIKQVEYIPVDRPSPLAIVQQNGDRRGWRRQLQHLSLIHILVPILSDALLEQLSKDYAFEAWGRVDAGHQAVRFVTSWATPEEIVREFIQDLHNYTASENPTKLL